MLTKERNPRTFPRAKTHIKQRLHYVLPRLERGIWVLPKYERNCQRIHPKKQALETIRHIGKKRRLKLSSIHVHSGAYFKKRLSESLKLHLTPKWIRQEKESLSTVQRGLFRSRMKRVSTAVY